MTPSSDRLRLDTFAPEADGCQDARLDPLGRRRNVCKDHERRSRPSRPLQIQSVVDHVYSALRERILSGDLPRGTKLRQASLAEELGVSRTPLREALRRLSTEGLVEFSPNRGATVSELDFGDMRHAWSARVALEPGAARLAAERRDPDAIAAMRDAVELQRQRRRRRHGQLRGQPAFHLALAAASGNPHLTRFAEMLWVPRIGVPIYQAQAAEPRGARGLGGRARAHHRRDRGR